MTKTCGLDVSTTTVGACVLDENGSILDMQYLGLKDVEPKNEDLLFEKLTTFEKWIDSLLARHGGMLFGIEDFLKGYAGGRTTMSTIIALAQFNGAVECSMRKKYGTTSVRKVHVRTARKLAIGFLPKAVDRGTKQVGKKTVVLSEKEWVFEWFGKNVEWAFEKRPKVDKPIEQAKDMVDAFVIAKATQSINSTKALAKRNHP